jgi:hypothetical protein
MVVVMMMMMIIIIIIINTICIAEKIYEHLETNKLLAKEQKGCIKNSQGCKEQLIIDSAVLEQAHKYNRNLNIAYIDNSKAFDSVPHSWLIRVLEKVNIYLPSLMMKVPDHLYIQRIQHSFAFNVIDACIGKHGSL